MDDGDGTIQRTTKNKTHLPTLLNSSNTLAASSLISLTFFNLSSRFLCESTARKCGLKPNQLKTLALAEFGFVKSFLVVLLLWLWLEPGGGDRAAFSGIADETGSEVVFSLVSRDELEEVNKDEGDENSSANRASRTVDNHSFTVVIPAEHASRSGTQLWNEEN